jgi:hypothetical protein
MVGQVSIGNASHKSFVPIEVFLKPEDYKKRIRSLEQTQDQDPGNPTVTFRGQRRSNQTHVSATDPDAKLANKGNGTAAMVGYTVDGLMENRHRLLLGINVETFRGPASEMDGGRTLLDTFHQKHAVRIQTVGADKGYFAKSFLTALVRRRITPHVALKTTGREPIHQRVRRLSHTIDYQLSQRVRKKIEELWGEAKCWHGFRRFQRRRMRHVRDEAYLMGWLLNLKRLATLLLAPAEELRRWAVGKRTMRRTQDGCHPRQRSSPESAPAVGAFHRRLFVHVFVNKLLDKSRSHAES